ncbi:hypothetical protein ACS0TY_003368 [Phlomoides rotata]
MASLHTCALVSHLIGVRRRPSVGLHAPSLISIAPRPHISKTHLHLRFGREVTVQVKNRWSPVFASNSHPSDGSNEKSVSDAYSGPPLLTIVAGMIVFLFLGWVIVSIMTWLIALIFNPPPLN